MQELAWLEIQPNRFIETDIKGYSRESIYHKAINWAMQVLSDELGWRSMSVHATTTVSLVRKYRLTHNSESAELTLIPKY